MTCREIYDFLDDYLESGLPESTRREFASHLDRCESCRRYLATYVKTKDVAIAAERALDRDAAPAPPPEELIQAVLDARRALRARQKRSEGL
jgi:anti-sigma factor RsiW